MNHPRSRQNDQRKRGARNHFDVILPRCRCTDSERLKAFCKVIFIPHPFQQLAAPGLEATSSSAARPSVRASGNGCRERPTEKIACPELITEAVEDLYVVDQDRGGAGDGDCVCARNIPVAAAISRRTGANTFRRSEGCRIERTGLFIYGAFPDHARIVPADR